MVTHRNTGDLLLPESPLHRSRYPADMAQVRTTATAKDVDPGHSRQKSPVLGRELFRIAIVQLCAAIQFRMAESRSVTAQSTDSPAPLGICQFSKEVVGMGTIDHEVSYSAGSCIIDASNSIPKCFS